MLKGYTQAIHGNSITVPNEGFCGKNEENETVKLIFYIIKGRIELNYESYTHQRNTKLYKEAYLKRDWF